MNANRNRWLLAALGLVVLFFAGDTAFQKFIAEPRDKNERLKEQLTKRIRDAKLELAKSKEITQQLEQLEQKSLPWDAAMARARYQDWLLQIAKDAKLEGTSVDAGDPVPVTKSGGRSRKSIELYKRFSFALHGRGTLSQVTQFLYDFYRAGHLHKIRSMSLNPLGQGENVDFNVAIDAIALPNADRETELTALVSDVLARQDVRDYQFISRRNFFGRGGTQSAWKELVLTAVTSDIQGVGEAWFRVGPQAETRILQLGQVMPLSAFDVHLVSLDETGATISVDGGSYHLTIGKSLAEAAQLAAPAASTPSAEVLAPAAPAATSEPAATSGLATPADATAPPGAEAGSAEPSSGGPAAPAPDSSPSANPA